MDKLWADGTPFTDYDAIAVRAVRVAGCKCRYPLLGWRFAEADYWHPRCRVCDAVGTLAAFSDNEVKTKFPR